MLIKFYYIKLYIIIIINNYMSVTDNINYYFLKLFKEKNFLRIYKIFYINIKINI